MRKSRVRLGPHLLAQTHPNPAPTGQKFFKIAGITFLIAAGVFLVKGLGRQEPAQSSPFPEQEEVLGVQAAPNAEFYLYQAQKGDSLFSISEKFKVKWETIVKLNGMSEPFFLKTGQQLKLPLNAVTQQQRFYDNLKNKIYVVAEGDSFVGIAQKLNISVTDLLRANPDLSSPDFIKVGQILRLP